MSTQPIDDGSPDLVETVVQAIKEAVARSGGPDGKLAYRPDEAAKIIGIGRGPFYELLAAGQLRARKLGSRTLILHSDLVAYLESLPPYPAGEASG